MVAYIFQSAEWKTETLHGILATETIKNHSMSGKVEAP